MKYVLQFTNTIPSDDHKVWSHFADLTTDRKCDGMTIEVSKSLEILSVAESLDTLFPDLTWKLDKQN